MKTQILHLVLFASLFVAARGAVVTWDGGGDGFSWTNRFNWSGDTLPAANDEAIIVASQNPVVLSGTNSPVIVRRLQCGADFVLHEANLVLTDGESQFEGSLSLFGGSLRVDGPTVLVSSSGEVACTNVSFYVANGAKLSLPGLGSFHGSSLWSVSGSGSILALPDLTNLDLTGAWDFNAYVAAGGQLIVSNLVSTGRPVLGPRFRATGTNSLVDLTSLTQGDISLEALEDGVVWSPQWAGGPRAGVNITAGGIMPVAQIRQLAYLTVSGAGMRADFAALTNLNGGDITVSDGAAVSLPALHHHIEQGWGPSSWSANGSGSVLELPGLTNIYVASGYNSLALEASGGGRFLASNLVAIAGGEVSIDAAGSGSLIDLSSVSGFCREDPDHEGRIPSSMRVSVGATILLNTQALLLANVEVRIPSGHPILPPNLAASYALTLYGRAGRSYSIDTKDWGTPGSPWQFYGRVPLTDDIQVVSDSVSTNRSFRVREFAASPPILDLAQASPQTGQLILYGTPGKSVRLGWTTNLNDPQSWTFEPGVELTNAFQFLFFDTTTMPVRFFRAMEE